MINFFKKLLGLDNKKTELVELPTSPVEVVVETPVEVEVADKPKKTRAVRAKVAKDDAATPKVKNPAARKKKPTT